MKRFLALLLLSSVATAQTYYDKTTIPPIIGANSVLCNATALVAAPAVCKAFILVAGATDNSSITRTGTLAGATQAFKVTNTYSTTPGTGGAAAASVTVNTTISAAAPFNDLVQGLSTNLTLATNNSGSGVSHQAFVAKVQKNSCYPATQCTKGYAENLVVNDNTGWPTSGGTYTSGGAEGSEADLRANDVDAAGTAGALIPASTGIRTGYAIVYKSFIPVSPSTPLTVTSASGDGATATLTYASQSSFPQIGSNIIVAGMTPSGYNTASSVVTASTATTVSYANATTGFTSGGTVSLPATEFGWGFRADGQTNDTLTVKRVFAVNNLTFGAGYTTEFATQDTNGSAFRMAGGQNIGFDVDTGSGATATAKHTLSYDEGNSQLSYQISGTAKFNIDDLGDVETKGVFGLAANPLLLGTKTYGTAVTVGACGSVACKNSIFLGGTGAGVAPNIKTIVTGTTQADLNFLIIPADAAGSSGLNGGNLILRGSAGDGAGTTGLVTIQDSINGATKIGTGTSTGTVTVGGGSNAVTLNATTLSLTGTLAGTTVSNYLTAPGPIGSVTPNTGAFSTLSATGLITPSTTVGVKGTAAADAAQAGSIGEIFTLNCLVGSAAAAGSAVSLPTASPGVVTWSGFVFTVTGPANWTCPINFSANGGALPTGLVAGTTYYIIGSTLSGSTFQVTDTAAHALAGTNAINFTGSPSGSPLAWIGYLVSNTNTVAGAGFTLTAGDWDCSGVNQAQELTSLTATQYLSGINTTVGQPTGGYFSDFRLPATTIGAANSSWPTPIVQENVSGSTTVYLIDKSSFAAGTQNEGGLLRCRRMR